MVKVTQVFWLVAISVVFTSIACTKSAAPGSMQTLGAGQSAQIAQCTSLYKSTEAQVMASRECVTDNDCSIATGFSGIFVACSSGKLAVNRNSDVAPLLAQVNAFASLCPLAQNFACASMDLGRSICDRGYCSFYTTTPPSP